MRHSPTLQFRVPARRWLLVLAASMLGAGQAAAQDSLCASVQLEIPQELAFERQAFEGRMRIANRLEALDIEDLSISLSISDADGLPVVLSDDPVHPGALFFARLDQLDGVSGISGDGTIPAGSDAEIRWLILPSPGAARGQITGTRYSVGATLSYAVAGVDEEIEVVPDSIVVRPQPELQLDYFLPADVRADDPFTSEVEPPVPFTFGVRVRNNGAAVARSLSIESAQPRIVNNELGLLVDFQITAAFVDDEPVKPTLLLDFDSIASQDASVGRWIMETSLSGEFKDLEASFVHSDDLGGALTSLITGVVAHGLLGVVIVDLPGRDSVLDFLGRDGTWLRVFESNGVDTDVADQSSVSAFTFQEEQGTLRIYELTTPVTAGPMYVRVEDPLDAEFQITRIVRSDGKALPSANGWSSTTGTGSETEHFLNFFDVNGGGNYRVEMGLRTLPPLPPAIQFIPDRSTAEGFPVGFVVRASDPNGTIPALSVDLLPVGARFVDEGGGLGSFSWTPAAGQSGSFPVTFRATDGLLDSTRTPTIRVLRGDDIDGDGVSDAWELEHFGTLDRDGTGDFDGDGISDKEEFELGLDPRKSNRALREPFVASPRVDQPVETLLPQLRVQNSAAADRPLRYDFEVHGDPGRTDFVAGLAGVPEGPVETGRQVDTLLAENDSYHWRARSEDGDSFSPWTEGSFRVDVVNEPPDPFEVSYPTSGTTVDSAQPILEVANSVDPDGEPLAYSFEVARDPDMEMRVASVRQRPEGGDGTTRWRVTPPLEEGTPYYWRAKATDAGGLERITPTASLVVDTVNRAPAKPMPTYPPSGSTVAASEVELEVANALDPENAALAYYFELDVNPRFDGPSLIASGPVVEGSTSTSFPVSRLSEDTTYHWRSRVSDGSAESGWANATFRVSRHDDAPSVPGVRNPGNGAWVDVRQPLLELSSSIDPEGDDVSYEFEVYRDPGLLDRADSATAAGPQWRIGALLENRSGYYWRARAAAGGAQSDWTAVHEFFVQHDGDNRPPIIRIDEPSFDLEAGSRHVRIRWSDSDPDSNAAIRIFAGAVLIATGIEEDPDADGDVFDWDVSGFPPGDYTLSIAIDDGELSATAVGCCVVTVPGPPGACDDLVDNDGDGAVDFPSDYGCVSGSAASEIGGDLDFDGAVSSADRELFQAAFGRSLGAPGFLDEADFDRDGLISIVDWQAWRAAEAEYEEMRYVPEPNGVLGLIVGVIALSMLSRVRR